MTDGQASLTGASSVGYDERSIRTEGTRGCAAPCWIEPSVLPPQRPRLLPAEQPRRAAAPLSCGFIDLREPVSATQKLFDLLATS